MPFHVGQKVTMKKECAGNPWRNPYGEPHAPGIKFPIYGEVYTVAKCLMWEGGWGEHLSLAEFVDSPPGYSEPYVYEAAAFRPVVERKTDISVFTKILDDCKAAAE
jgi:hypothetical protein